MSLERIKDQLGIAIVALNSALEDIEALDPDAELETSRIGPPDEECRHPKDQREDMSTFGSRAKPWRCKVCGYKHEPEISDD